MTQAMLPTVSYPSELQFIKALFLHKHYRQCIQSCRDFLSSPVGDHLQRPLQETFANFYLGLAHDELARMMHHHSHAKIPAFDQAKQFYSTALQSLPSSAAAIRSLTSLVDSNGDPFIDGTSFFNARRPVQGPLADVTNVYYPSTSQSSHLNERSIPPASLDPASLEVSSYNVYDLDSHETFDKITTTRKTLQRDLSRMSLLDDLHAPVRSRTIQTSMSEGLLRPIRPGSPAKQYHVPPRLPYPGSVPSRSRLPKLITSKSSKPPTEIRIPSSVPEEPLPRSPVSSLNSSGVVSETSTISAMSPMTPVRASSQQSHSPTPTKRDALGCPVEEHLVALRDQLECHLRMVEAAKQHTVQAQAKRAASREEADNQAGEEEDRRKRMPHSRSYWSFTPDHVKVNVLERRILAGRDRGWARARFEPRPYVELAERALDEL